MKVLSVSWDNRKHYEDMFPAELRFLLYRKELGCLGLLDMENDAGGDAIPAGVCIYSAMTDDAITIEWLYIIEAYRGEGYSELLLDSVCATALYNDRSRIIAKVWSFDSMFPESDSFLIDTGFLPMAAEVTDQIFDLSELKASIIEKYRPKGDAVKSFSELPSAVVGVLKGQAEGMFGTLSDIDMEMSQALIREGQPLGCIVIRRIGDTCFPALVRFEEGTSSGSRVSTICRALESASRLLGEKGMFYLECEAFDPVAAIAMFFGSEPSVSSSSYYAPTDLKKRENKTYRRTAASVKAYLNSVDAIPTHMVMVGLEDYIQ